MAADGKHGGSESRARSDASAADDLRSELDELMNQLVDHAEAVSLVQGRLRGLLVANSKIFGDLELCTVLRHVVEAACRLVNARYGALGVLGPAGGLSEFITVGIDDAGVAEMGPPPTGAGLLGALIDDPRPIRLSRITDDLRSAGFPENHPPMDSFLGVPIRVHDEVFGNLYLTDAESGEFSVEDQALVTALAATAGVAIENARLFSQARLRETWLQAATRTTRQLLSQDGERPLELIAQQTRQVADADLVTVVLPMRCGARLRVEVAAGANAERLTGYSYPVEHTYVGRVFQTSQPLLVREYDETTDTDIHLSRAIPVGPLMVLPLLGAQQMRGALTIGRRRGRPPFDEADLDMATTFANHAAIAMELADARQDQQRMLLLEERDRIARDLHDHVIQQLFAAGLSVQSVLAARPDDPHSDRLAQVVTSIDDTIRRIRTTIFRLHGGLGPPRYGAVRTRVLDVADQVAVVLGFEPRVEFAGPVEAVLPERVMDDVVAVVREALTNVAKHAGATRAAVRLTADSERLVIDVVDDGKGLGSTSRRSGLANLAHRARRLGGTMTLTDGTAPGDGSGAREGAQLTWSISLTTPR